MCLLKKCNCRVGGTNFIIGCPIQACYPHHGWLIVWRHLLHKRTNKRYDFITEFDIFFSTTSTNRYMVLWIKPAVEKIFNYRKQNWNQFSSIGGFKAKNKHSKSALKILYLCRGVAWLDGALGKNKFGATLEQMYCSEESTCDIAGTFRRPLPQWFDTRGFVLPLPTLQNVPDL